MPLINCPDCGKEISDSAPQCIHCGSLSTAVGNQQKEARKFFRGVSIFGSTLFLIFYSFIILGLILFAAIFNWWKTLIFFILILLGSWWLWIMLIRKTRIK